MEKLQMQCISYQIFKLPIIIIIIVIIIIIGLLNQYQKYNIQDILYTTSTLKTYMQL